MVTYSPEQIENARNNPNRFLEKQLADMIGMGALNLEELTDSSRKDKGLPVLDNFKAQKVQNMLKARGAKVSESEDWKRATTENNYAAYIAFVDAHPNSPHRDEAEQLARTMKAQNMNSEYDKVMNGIGVSIAEMQAFVEAYPGTTQALEVQKKINGLLLQEIEAAWKSCISEADYQAFRTKYPTSNHCSEIEGIVQKMHFERQREDEEAWKRAQESGDVGLLNDYLQKYSIHKAEAAVLVQRLFDEADDRAWERVKLSGSKIEIQDYLSHFSSNGRVPRHQQEACDIEQQLRDEERREPLIIEEINRILANPYKDVPDYLELCKKYPSKKKEIKAWMLGDMKRTPGRYQRDEMYTLMFKDGKYLTEPLFTPQEIISSGVLSQERVDWISTKPIKKMDDPNEVTPKETCFDTEKNNTDVFFFGVPGSGKTSVLAGLLSASNLGEGYNFKYLSSGCMHVGYNYAVNLVRAINNHVFPARTRISNLTDSMPSSEGIGVQPQTPIGGAIGGGIGGSIGTPVVGGIGTPPIGGVPESAPQTSPQQPTNSDEDLFIQIIDAKIQNRETGSENKISIVEMPGERTLRFAAAKANDMTMLGEGTAKLFNNDNHKVFFFIIDPNDKKLNEVKINNSYVQVTQAQALTAVADFLVEMVKKGNLKNLDSVHVIMSKSDLIPLKDDYGNSVDMKTSIDNIMHKSDYQNLVNSLYGLCDHKIGDVNKHCDHKPKLFTFTLGRILPGDMFDYDSEDSVKILKVIKANTISVGAPTVWDTICGIANRKLF